MTIPRWGWDSYRRYVAGVATRPRLGWDSVSKLFEPEVYAYLDIPGVGITQSEKVTLNNNIKLIKYSTGVALTSVTANLSTVNGTAFISNPSVDLRPYVGFKCTITAGGKTLPGWIKAAGLPAGESYLDMITGDNSTFASDTGDWTRGIGWTIGSNKATLSKVAGAAIYMSIVPGITIGNLYHAQYTIDSIAGGGCLLNLGNLASLNIIGNSNQITAGTFAGYSTCSVETIEGLAVRAAAATTAIQIDNLTFRKVITPSITGVIIVNAQGGSVFNFVSDDGINLNAASFTVTITES